MLRKTLRFAALLLAISPVAVAQGSTAQKLADLKSLRDAGVLSQADYEQRVAALRRGGAAASPQTTPVSTAVPHSGSGAPGKYDTSHFGQPTVTHTISDAQWGIPWGTVKLPPNWTVTSQVVHAGSNGCTATGHGLFVVMESPDKQFSLGIFPALKSQWAQGPGVNLQQAASQGCFISPTPHAVDFIARALEPKIHPNTRFQVIGVMQAPEQQQIAAQIQQMNQSMQMPAVQGMRNQQTVEPVRVFVRVNEGGRNYIEGYSMTYACMRMQMQGMSLPNMPRMQGFDQLDCSVYNLIVQRMPDDGSDPTKQPDDASVKPFFSVQPNPQWQQKLNQVSQQENEAMQRQTTAQHQQNMQNIQAIGDRAHAQHQADMQRSDQIMNNYQNRQAANDAVQQGRIDYLSNSQRVTNPNTGATYRINNQMSNTYFDNNGNALSTNSAYSPGVDWTLGTQVH